MSDLLFLVTGVFLYLLAKALSFFIPRWRSPLNQLRGPQDGSLILGHFKQLDADYHTVQAKWFVEYGPTMRISGIFNVSVHL